MAASSASISRKARRSSAARCWPRSILPPIRPSTIRPWPRRRWTTAQLDNAKRDLERYAQLGANVIAQKTIDTQRALVAQLTAQIQSDDAAIANAKAFLDYTTIVAPIDGRTGIRLVDEGNLVRASDAGIVVITEVRPISVLFTLPQQQLVQINQALAGGSVSLDALDSDNKTVLDRGVLQVVDNQVDPTTGTIRMKAEFPNTDLQLWPGQFVNVRVLIDTLKQVVVVPTPAVQRGPNGTFAYVVADRRQGGAPIHRRDHAERERGHYRQGHRRRRARGDDGLCPPQGRLARHGGFARGHDVIGVGRQGARQVGRPRRPQRQDEGGLRRRRRRSSAPPSSAARCAGACRSNAAQLSETCKSASATGTKAREADARKVDSSSMQ